jgi:DNA-directed RNA polymerase subunit RPC12/RpoP
LVLIQRQPALASPISMSIRIQCESCQRTFQVPDESEGKQTRCPSCQTLILIKRPAAPAAPESQVIREASAPFKATPVKARPATPQSNYQRPSSQNNDGIPVSCMACGKELRAPGKAAGKAIRCPGCQGTIPVPNEGSFQPIQVQPVQTYTPQRTNSYPANPLQDDSLWSSIPPASANVPYSGSSGFDNPYDPAPSYSGGGSRSGSSKASRVLQYNIIGVLMMASGGLILLGCIVEPILIAVGLSNLPQNAVIDYSKLTPFLVKAGIYTVVGIILAIALLQGGYRIYYQVELKTARQIALFCAIPCCGYCLFPVGIWACILLYGKNANRDFGG